MLIMALQISEMLMQKLPDIFAKMFVKEGVVHALDTLIASDQAGPASTPQQSRSADAAPSAAGGMLPPPRPRRGGGGRRKLTGNYDEELGLISSTLPPMGVSPPPAAAAVRPIRSSLRASAIAQAKRVRETYFPGDAGASGEGITESLRRLKSLCARLNGDNAAEVKGKGKGKAKGKVAGTEGLSEEQLVSLMVDLLAELSGGEGVSTFEFIGSGVVGTLLNFFSCGNTGKESIGDTVLRQQTLKRLKKFSEVALPANTGITGELTPLTLLVRKLQDALASLEGFPVRFSHAPRASSSSASISNGMNALTQPFKLRLCRSSGEKMLRDYSTNIVLIEPLASLISVEDFLWPRVKRHEASTAVAASTSEASAPIAAPTSEIRQSTRSRSAAIAVEGGRNCQSSLNANASKGKGKAVGRSLGSSSSGDEGWGPETRHTAACRRAAAWSASAPKASPEGESEVSDEVQMTCKYLRFRKALDVVL
jgi:E3 ubiquitin-protein ligase TRIP12